MTTPMAIVHICGGGPVYRFEGWLFEVHRYVGPHPLNKNGDPRATPPGRKFWKMWDRFSALSKSEQKQYLHTTVAEVMGE